MSMPRSSLYNCPESYIPRIKDLSGPDPVIRDLLPKQLRDIIYVNRRSSRIQKIRQYFMKYTDLDALLRTTEDVWDEVIQINRFLHILLLVNSKKKDPEDQDDAHFFLYHADAPEILLEMLFRTMRDLGKHLRYQCLPFLAIETLTTFIHPKSLTSMHVTEKIFNDSKERVELLVKILNNELTWFDKLAVTKFFSAASQTPAGVYFIMSHLDSFQELCELTYRATEIVEKKIEEKDGIPKEGKLAILLRAFRLDNDFQLSARLFSHIAAHNCIMIFRYTIRASINDPEVLFEVMKTVSRASVVEHFSYIIKRLMIWVEPGQYLNEFLEGMSYCVDIPGAVEELFLSDIESAKENRLSIGIDSFKYWKHETRYPMRLTWLLTHAFALRDDMGSGWCIVILCHLLEKGNWVEVGKLMENCGSELMDLAHLLNIETPERTRVQSVILEALLRFGGFSYYEFGKGPYHEDKIKPDTELASYSLEAALYCKKAQCEMKMSTEEKQRRVAQADVEKDKGNIAFKAGKFNEAVMRYTDAIAICPLSARSKQSIYYSNRAESYLRANEPRRAIHDCNRALCLDLSTRVKVQWRRSRAFQKLNLDYPAWLDMKCIKSEWNIPAEKSGVDFRQLLSSLTSQVGIMKKSVFNDMEKKIWASHAL